MSDEEREELTGSEDEVLPPNMHLEEEGEPIVPIVPSAEEEGDDLGDGSDDDEEEEEEEDEEVA
jgi:hypothetical protein